MRNFLILYMHCTLCSLRERQYATLYGSYNYANFCTVLMMVYQYSKEGKHAVSNIGHTIYEYTG